MELKDALYTRRSIRSYTGQKVTPEQIKELIGAAVQAPSGMNSQPWAFGIINDRKVLDDYSERTKKYLLASTDKFPALERYKETFENPGYHIFHGAPALIIIYAKPLYGSAYADCCLAAQNLMLTAHDIGLGTCWIGFASFLLNTPELFKELNIPEGYQAVAPIAVGYPEKTPGKIEKNTPEILFSK